MLGGFYHQQAATRLLWKLFRGLGTAPNPSGWELPAPCLSAGRCRAVTAAGRPAKGPAETSARGSLHDGVSRMGREGERNLEK